MGKHVRCSSPPRPPHLLPAQGLSALQTRHSLARPDMQIHRTSAAPQQRLMHEYSSPSAHVCISVHSCIVWWSGGLGCCTLELWILWRQGPSLCVAVWLWWAEWSLERPLPLYCIEQKVIDLFRTVPLGRALPAWTRPQSWISIY